MPVLILNGHLWIIFLWLVAAVGLPFADFKIQFWGKQFGKQMATAEKRRLICL
jgi:hypothetical protein